MTTTRLALALVLAIGCRQDRKIDRNEPTPEPLAEATTPVAEPEAPTGLIGVLTPKAQAEVAAPFTTTVKQFFVNVGDRVEVGTKLALLDEAPLKEALTKADADVKGARASYASAAQSAATQLRAFQAGVAARTSYETAVGAASEAKARLDGALAGYEAARTKLGKTTVVSQIAGKVALLFVKAGGNITEGSPILRVISSDELYVRFAIPTDQTSRFAEGISIELSIAGHEKTKVKGKVVSVQPELDPIARMIFAEAELEGEVPADLQAGLVCRIAIPAQPAPQPAAPRPKPAPPPSPATPPPPAIKAPATVQRPPARPPRRR